MSGLRCARAAPGWLSRGQRRHLPDFARELALGNCQIVGALQIEPEIGTVAAQFSRSAKAVCICSEFFWPKPPPAYGEMT